MDLTRKRATLKAQLTRFLNFATENEINDDEMACNFRTRVNKMANLLEKFEQIQSENDVEDDESSEQESFEFEERYFMAISCANAKLNKYESTVKAKISECAQSGDIPHYAIGAKLPEVSLPAFDGDYTQWREFHDTFKALVDTNCNISKTAKLCYLKASLRGEAASLLAFIEATEDNYDVALNLLMDRYDNKRRIINNHVKGLLEMDVIARESHAALLNLIDTAERHMRCLKNLGLPTEHWDALVVPILVTKLDNNAVKAWEMKISEKTARDLIPSYNELIAFLKQRHVTLEAVTPRKQTVSVEQKAQKRGVVAYVKHESKFACYNCKSSEHTLYKCEDFLKLSVDKRISRLKGLKLCFNCFKRGHTVHQCNSSSCRTCGKKHNTIIHTDTIKASPTAAVVQSETPVSETGGWESPALCARSQSQVLLSTAIVKIEDIHGNFYNARALLDCGAQSSFITEELVNRLHLHKYPLNFTVTGVGQAEVKLQHQVTTKVRANKGKFNFTVDLLVIDKITDKLPISSFDINSLKLPKGLELADPSFNERGNIDILLGSATFWNIINSNQIKLSETGLILQDTSLGWIVGGKINVQQPRKTINCHSTNMLHEQLTRFWRIDEVQEKVILSKEEEHCEEFFKETYQRNQTGRFIVRIPMKGNIQNLGQTFDIAKQRLDALHVKLDKNEEMKKHYTEFLDEYECLGHMTKLQEHDKDAVYLPHHCVIKETSDTTKLRVVFDASLKTSTGLSVNDLQCVGPNIQRDLFSILNNFRMYKYVITGDVEKMYRQVLVHPEDRKLQRILWRKDKLEETTAYELNTVTYGTASASYLATRCIKELSLEFKEEYPIECNIIQNCFYVDDLIMGAHTVEELKLRRDNISKILMTGQFNLRKWRSNIPELSEKKNIGENLSFKEAPVKTLGILWDPKEDILLYDVQINNKDVNATKRSILALTAQLFDPYGFLQPVIIIPKLLIQELWRRQLRWDEPIKLEEAQKWKAFREELKHISEIRIERHALINNYDIIELHGFSDASERAYGACVYVKSVDDKGNCKISLIGAKSRVAPLKAVNLPRLELCAAVLLAQIFCKLKECITEPINQEYLWTDSTIVLCWIRAEPIKWPTFVANRVAEIRKLTNYEDWRHVKSKENPADLISRGKMPRELIDNHLWWSGPEWLKHEIEVRDLRNTQVVSSALEYKEVSLISVQRPEIIDRYSNLTKLVNVTAYCLRFKTRRTGFLTLEEKDNSLNTLIRQEQRFHFAREFEALEKQRLIPNKSPLKSLAPFLDNQGLLRVGGRLKNSNLEFNKKHQIILPAKSRLTELIISYYHRKLFHCGPQTLLHNIRERYWPIRGKISAKKIFRHCVTCFKTKPQSLNAPMGELPNSRTTPAPAFYTCGIDYAGPITLKETKLRKARIFKSYIAIFVCFVSKAIHIEIVLDLSTDYFISALRRFISRRGKPREIYTDNATNFLGANNELKKILISEKIHNALNDEGIRWSFIPPRSPHHGGLWEAGVRSIKTHIKRVVGESVLTLDQMNTLLIQIEACLNSRPLSPLSDNPSDLSPLTPGHFIIGRPLTALPDCSTKDYKHVQNMFQHFWNRWKREYLHTLQVRYKWQRGSQQPKVGDLVVIKDDNTPPLQWKMARIEAVIPGADGIIRVAEVRTANGVVKRSIQRLCILPIF